LSILEELQIDHSGQVEQGPIGAAVNPGRIGILPQLFAGKHMAVADKPELRKRKLVTKSAILLKSHRSGRLLPLGKHLQTR